MSQQPSIRLSVLDRSLTRQGQPSSAAPRATVRFAQQVESFGYQRFWVSEHHSVPGIAGSAPTVLAAAVAAATERIRVGTGGVMLPNHQPLVVAEQFGVLESLFPGRIDMGLGRSAGFTAGIRRALGRQQPDAEQFQAQLAELLGYFTGEQETYPGVHATPGEGLRPSAFLLAVGAGAEQAAVAGLPLVIAPIGGQTRMVELIERYRTAFRPSGWAAEPYVVVSAVVAVADTARQARDLLVPEAWSTVYSRTHGVFPPLAPPAEILGLTMTDRERALLDDVLAGQLHGTGDEVGAALTGLVARTGADEILVSTSMFDQDDRIDSARRLAALVGANRS
ncbi:MAG TPA: MsnO8 family LLM class oxidoreductase [Pseudonocardiaceae bacterium]|nr:MsnO8 family LLM class oxidoreductase [Pseudonocardiaceae bacterium]